MTATATTIADFVRTTTQTRGARTGFRLLAVGLALGAAADTALRGGPWGLGATVMTAALLAALLWLQLDQGTPAGPGRLGYALAALVFGAQLAWRDAPALKLLDVFGLAVSLGLLASARDHLEGPASLGRYVLRVTGTVAHACVAPPLLATTDADWSGLPHRGLPSRLLAFGRGLAITVPVLVVFTALLASADAVFALRVTEVFDVDIYALLGHLVGIAFWSWVAAGLLRAAVLRDRPAHALPPRPAWLALGRLEVVMLLGTLDLLFAAFVWVQLRYLFGGARRVQEIAGLTYAEYARSGFFELVAVAGLVLALLLAVHWLARSSGAVSRGAFGALAAIQVLLVFVMLASALERMRLYQEEFGLTELRFYTTAFMIWVGVLLAAFLVTVLRDRRDLFAHGVLGSAFLAVVLLHASDPEAWIVRSNVALPRGLDVKHALTLSRDAVPALVEALPALDPGRRAAVLEGLQKQAAKDVPDWRTWSVGRARARRAMEAATP